MKLFWYAFPLFCSALQAGATTDYDVTLKENSSSISHVLVTQKRIEGFTFCLWFRLFEKKGQRVLVSLKEVNSTANNSVSLVYHDPNVLQLHITNQSVNVSVPELFTGEWHHTCAAWNTTHGRWVVMVDGEVQQSCNGLSNYSSLENYLTVNLGKRSYSSSTSQAIDESFRGQMSSFYFWEYEILIRDMRQMFEECQPQHVTKSTLGWDSFWGNIGPNASTPSRCHKKRNLARKGTTIPAEAHHVVDGDVRSSCSTISLLWSSRATVKIDLNTRALISEVFIILASTSIQNVQIEILVSNDAASVTCGSVQDMISDQSGVFYCNKPLNGTKLIIKFSIYSLSSRKPITLCEVLIYGEYDDLLPLTIFPLSNNSQKVTEFKGENFQLHYQQNIKFGPGIAGEKYGSSVFEKKSTIEYIVDQDSIASQFSSGSFSMSAWISIEEYSSKAHIVGFVKQLVSHSSDATHISLVSPKNVRVVFGSKGSVLYKTVTHEGYFDFQNNFWYHLVMTYNGESKEASMFRDNEQLFSMSQNLTILTSNKFVIGTGFIGKIACVQVYDQAIHPLEAGRIFYRCLDGQPALPPPIAFFPFSDSQTLQNVVDTSMRINVSGELATSSSERTGVLNEPYKAVRFSSDTMRELRVSPSSPFQPRFALSVCCWIMMKSTDSNTFFKHDKLKLNIEHTLYEVELTYKNEVDHFKYKASGTTKLRTERWYFISFSFTSVRGGSVLLELDGQVEHHKENIASVSQSITWLFGEEIELGHHLDGKMACVQVYDAWLTGAQRTMAKYKCLDEIEQGIYQMPVITSVSFVSQTQAVVSWLKVDYPIRGLIQGYRVTYSTTNITSWSILLCNESSTTLNSLQTGLVYNISVQALGRKDGPKYQLVNFTIPEVPISPPTNITAISTGTSSIRITWVPSTSPALGYYVSIQALDNNAAGDITVILCPDVTAYEFQGLTAMTDYLVKVGVFDSKKVGKTGENVTVKTDEEAPLNEPYNVRVLNIKYGTPCIYVNWQHKVSSSLRGILRGFAISIWPTDGNESQAKNYSVIAKRYHKMYDLDVGNKYTAVVYPFTTRVGPGSDPTTSKYEEAVKYPPTSFFVSVDESCSMIKLRWYHPDRSVTFGLVRHYRVKYYTYSEGPQAAINVIVTPRSLLNVTKINSSQTYAICVAARSLPDTPFGPCTDTLNITTNCSTSRTGSVSEWSNWTNCSQRCEGGIRNRSRTCLTSPCYSNLTESEFCNTNHCPVITLEANFTEELWNENLVESESTQFKDLESKIRKNMDLVYEGASRLVKNVKLIKSWQGSVMASVNVTFFSSTADEILRLQEWMDINGTIGLMPVIPTALYSYTVARKGPVISSISSITTTSAQVTWTSINTTYYHGYIQGYRINYRPSTINTWQSTNRSSSCLSTVVSGLEPMATYRFRVQGITENGNGIVGPASLITMPQLVSKASPGQVKAAALSSTVITVEWSHILLDQISGTFLGYRVVCMEEDTRTALLRTASSWTDWMMVDDLKKFTWYLIRVVGFSDQGSSASSEVIRVRTLEDVPSAPPSAATVHDMYDTSTIDIQWSTVPLDHRNGIILGHKLTCRENADDSNSLVFSKTYSLSASATKFTLHNLNASTSYLFELLAYTSKGDGVVTKLTGATCNCEREVYTNWYDYPPYVSKDDTRIPGGIFGPLVKEMILTACGECPNGHGRSVLSFSDNGKGELANKHSQYDVINDIDDVTDVSFPVRGYVGDTKFLKYYTYVSLLESPGTAFLTVRKDESTSMDEALYSTLSDCWPVIILAFSMALLAGILIWFLECSSNPEQFPPLFLQGAWEGLWFCYISMTTVGYGDRAPVTVLARILTFVWTLTGLLIISICMGLIASSLTVVVASLEKHVILYGTKVSAVENSTEYRIGLLKNAKMHAYPSLTSSYQALGNGGVDGVLVDAYVAGSLQDIISVNTYVNRIIDSGSYTYGVVLSGKVVRLEKACSQYIQSNKAMISHWIKKNIKPLQSSPAVVLNTSEPPAHVVNQPKSNFSAGDVIIVLLLVLGVCICSGLVWEAYLRLKIQKEDKIKQDMERRRACLHQVVKEFYNNCNTTWSKLRRKHVKELKTFYNLNKGKGSISKS